MTTVLAVQLLAATLFAANRAVPAGPAAPRAGAPAVRLIVEPLAEGSRRDYISSEQSKAIEATVQAAAGRAKVLKADGAGGIFDTHAYMEAAPEALPELAKTLEAAGLAVIPLSDALAAAEQKPEKPAASDEEIGAIAARIFENRKALERSRDLGAVLAAVETADVSRLNSQTRRDAAGAIYHGLVAVGNAFNAIRGDQRIAARQRFLDAQGGRKYEYVDMERFAIKELQDPALKAEAEPTRALIRRAVHALDRLGGSTAEEKVLALLPFAENAAFEIVAADPGLRKKYAEKLLSLTAYSVAETIAGLVGGFDRDDGWSGSGRSGGYSHLDDRRNSTHLYKWERFRQDPGELPMDALQLLGLETPELPFAELIVKLLVSVQNKIPEIDALNRVRRIAYEMRGYENMIVREAAKAEAQGRPMSAEDIARWRASALEQANEKYDEHDKVHGHNAVDRLLTSLGYYNPYYPPALPGFDERRYIANVLGVFREALDRVTEAGLMRQVADSAVSFLTTLVEIKRLGPAQRAEAAALWKLVAAKNERHKLGLHTFLDGVIDRRPEIAPSAPLRFEGQDERQWAVWGVSESPDGRFVARTAADRSVLVWDALSGQLLVTLKLDDARQHYGDSANSSALAWTGDGKLVVAAVFDDDDKKGYHNRVRVFDLNTTKDVLGPKDALSEHRIPGVYALRHMPTGPNGLYLAARVDRHTKRSEYSSDYAGSDVKLFDAAGAPLSQIDDATLLDAQGARLLTGAPHIAQPSLRLWDVSDPAAPRDVSPAWLAVFVEVWKKRNPASKYGYWDRLDAKLGSLRGQDALIVHESGTLTFLDMRTSKVLAQFAIPNAWRADAYVVSADGAALAAVVRAPGAFGGKTPERLMVWDLTTGGVAIDRETSEVSQLSFTKDGKLITGGKNGVEVFAIPPGAAG